MGLAANPAAMPGALEAPAASRFVSGTFGSSRNNLTAAATTRMDATTMQVERTRLQIWFVASIVCASINPQATRSQVRESCSLENDYGDGVTLPNTAVLNAPSLWLVTANPM